MMDRMPYMKPSIFPPESPVLHHLRPNFSSPTEREFCAGWEWLTIVFADC